MRILSLLTVLIITIPSVFSNNNYISGVFINPVSRYFDMDMEANNNDYPVEEVFVNDIIQVISGMIYGWDFTYNPSDIKREISEEFTLRQIAVIKKSDPNMKFKDNWVKDYIMYQNIVYYLADFQKSRIKSWNTSLIPDSYGEGEESIYVDEGKSKALETALKDSIKREFQSRGKDKPKEISGQILLKENPRVFIDSGVFKVQVKVLILYKNIEEFKFH